MESPSNTPGVQPWETYFPQLTKKPRIGQWKTWQIAASDGITDRLIVLPTGYGKTDTGLGYYGIRRELGLVNRCLWVVSSDEQRRQLSPEADRHGNRPAAASDSLRTTFGLECLETVRADGSASSVRMHLEDRAEIFVTTYQTILYNVGYFQDLMDTADGRWSWLVIGDEAHHLSDEGKWAEALANLPRAETLYMSATPVRTDRRPLRGVPAKDGVYDACVEREWRDAIDEGAIRQPVAHAEEWSLQFENRSGERITITSSDLREEGVAVEKDFDDFWVRHNLRRFTFDFLDEIFLHAMKRLNEKRLRWPGRHQMLVFAIGNSHAQFLANEVFGRLTDADWVGVLRSDKENEAVMKRYKEGELSVLVQVDKAGEGFDHPPASVALFLNMIQSQSKLLQQLGRVLRRDEEIPQNQDHADVFADTAHPVIDVVRELEPADKSTREGTKEPGGGDGPGWDPMPDLVEIEAKWMQTQLVLPDGMGFQHEPGVIEAAERYGLSPDQVEDILRITHGLQSPSHSAPRSGGEVQRRAFYQDRVDRATRAIVSGAIKLIAEDGDEIPKALAGQLKRRLNGRWKGDANRGHDEMLSEDFKAKYDWLQGIYNAMGKTGKVPAWLRHGW